MRDVDSIAVEGVPDIIPLDGFRERPIGSDPDEIKKCPSPSTVGITENDLYIDRT